MLNTIYIMWLRQLKRYFRSKSRIIGSIGQPLLFLLALGFGMGPVYQRAGGGDYLQFLAPGVIAMSILFTSIFSGMEIIWDRQFGFLKETMVAPVSRFEIMLGRTLGGATVATIQGLIVLIVSLLAGFRPHFVYLPWTILIMAMIALLFTSLGTAIASRLSDMQGFQLIMNFFVMPLFFLSGALFPLEGLPRTLDIITRMDPLSYGVDALRATTLAQEAHFGLSFDLFVLGSVTLFFLWLGARLFSKIQI